MSNHCVICDSCLQKDQSFCLQCNWENEELYFHELSREDMEVCAQKETQARLAWYKKHNYIAPEIAKFYIKETYTANSFKRDYFEYLSEFTERLKSRPYYIGKIQLVRELYDIDAGIFPVSIQWENWASPVLKLQLSQSGYFFAERDIAKILDETAKEYPLFAWLDMHNNRPILHELQLYAELDSQKKAFSLVECRYLSYNNGTFVDINNKLMWKQCAEGQTWENNACVGNALNISWHDAKKREWDIFSGYDNWRMPTIHELKTLMDSHHELKRFQHIFKAWFWSSSSDVPKKASRIYLKSGEIVNSANMDGAYHVILVRNVV